MVFTSNGCKKCFSSWTFTKRSVHEQPLGYVNQTCPNLIFRLKFFLYNLKQAHKVWSDKIGRYLVTSRFQTPNANFSLYVKKTNHGIVVVVIYDDDLIIIGDSDANISYLKKKN
jgi:hypothetical protein